MKTTTNRDPLMSLMIIEPINRRRWMSIEHKRLDVQLILALITALRVVVGQEVKIPAAAVPVGDTYANSVPVMSNSAIQLTIDKTLAPEKAGEKTATSEKN